MSIENVRSLVKEVFVNIEHRRLEDLISVGPAMVRDFELLGVHSVAQLARRNPERLYHALGRVARSTKGSGRGQDERCQR